jgi:iron complex outermembrane receptor protein
LDNVARIEIIRGPGSALYGADAYSGVVNIITKTAKDINGTKLGARGGSFDTWNTWAQHGGKWGELDVAAYVNVGGTDGFKKTLREDNQTGLDSRFGTDASLAPGPVNTGYDSVDANLDLAYDKWRLRSGYKLRDNVGMGVGFSSALDPIGKDATEQVNADLSWNDAQLAKNWGAGFIASFLHNQEEGSNYHMFPAGTRLGPLYYPDGMIGSPGRWERQIRVSGFVNYTGFTDHNLRLGVGHDDLSLYKARTLKNFYLNPTGIPIPTGPVSDYGDIQPHILPHTRTNNYFYLQDEWSFARDWTLTAGVRYDSYSDFGTTVNPRLAIVWAVDLDLTAKFQWGRAFRAPAFNEQYGVNPSAGGNPDLKPETIDTYEVDFSWQARRDTQVNLSLFQYDLAQIISVVANPAPAPGLTYQNTGKQVGRGLELETVWDATSSLRLTGNYSFQTSIDETHHQDAGYVPHHHVYARSDWRFMEPWLLSGQINWVGDRKRAYGDARPPINDYTTFDLTLRTMNSTRGWDFAASIRNLFDATVLEPSLAPGTAIPYDLPMAGRSFYLQAGYQF